MLNKNILPKKLPYADQFSSVEECLNYMVKTLNSTFTKAQDIVETTGNNPISPITLDGEEVSGSYGITSGQESVSVTINHTLGVTPTKWILTDSVFNLVSARPGLTISRTGWTTTTITFRITVGISGGTFVGTFKVLVLR